MGTQPPPARKGYHSNPQRSSGNTSRRNTTMFEACFRVTALIESDGLGHTIFKVYERREPVSEDAFFSLIKATYEQRVSPLLQIGDDLTMILHVNLPNADNCSASIY